MPTLEVMMEQKKKKKGSEMRKAWFNFVKKTRGKMHRMEKRDVTHREAMKQASLGWADEKAKVERKIKREAKRKAKVES